MTNRNYRRYVGFALVFVFAALIFQGCATLEDLAGALVNLQRLKFKLGAVHDFTLLGIPIGAKTSLKDLTYADGLALLEGFQSQRLPAEFVLDVLAVNPNDGTGGSRKTVSTLTSLESRLLIDGTPTVTGNIDRPVEIPGTGQETVISIRLGIDLYEFFGKKGFEEVIGLALALGGRGGDSTRISLDAQPRVSTPIGSISYPGRITIVSAEFR